MAYPGDLGYRYQSEYWQYWTIQATHIPCIVLGEHVRILIGYNSDRNRATSLPDAIIIGLVRRTFTNR